MSYWLMFGFQDGSSPSQEQMVFFHDHTMISLVVIMVLVAYYMLSSFFNSYSHFTLLHGQLIEFLWTVLPCFVLMFIALPSIRLLYLLDETTSPGLTIKAVGHQWYWSYEYADFQSVEMDSYMLPKEDLGEGGFRLLDVDNRLVIPHNLNIRALVSSTDVLHSWTIPSLGVKADAVPGRLNQISFVCLRPGVFYGQCSEICGANHSFMPVVLESVGTKDFVGWLYKEA